VLHQVTLAPAATFYSLIGLMVFLNGPPPSVLGSRVPPLPLNSNLFLLFIAHSVEEGLERRGAVIRVISKQGQGAAAFRFPKKKAGAGLKSSQKPQSRPRILNRKSSRGHGKAYAPRATRPRNGPTSRRHWLSNMGLKNPLGLRSRKGSRNNGRLAWL
jgi:hypothetical protein